MTTIGDLLEEVKVLPGAEDDFPVLTLTEKNGFVHQSDRFHKRLATDDTSKYKVVRRDWIAFNPYLLWAGAVAQNTIEEAGIISPLYPTFRVREDFDPGYVAKLLLAPEMILRYDKIAFGSVPRRRRSSVKDFLSLDVGEVGPLATQRRIAAILDRAQELCKSSEATLQHLSDLTGAEFDRRFFGLPSDKIRLGDIVIDIDSGKSPKCESFSAESGGWGVLKLSAVTGGTYRPSENKAIFDKSSILQKNEVHVGDVLMTRKNTPELVGEVCYVDKETEKMLIPDLIFRINLDTEKISGKFFQAMMMRPAVREKVRALAGGSAKSMSNISKARLREMEISVPPFGEQQKFEEFLDKTLVLRGEVSSLNSLYSKMFSSLQSRAFRGEL